MHIVVGIALVFYSMLELRSATMLSFDKNISFVVFLFKMMLTSATAAFTHYTETRLVASDIPSSTSVITVVNTATKGRRRSGHRKTRRDSRQ